MNFPATTFTARALTMPERRSHHDQGIAEDVMRRRERAFELRDLPGWERGRLAREAEHRSKCALL